MPAKIAMTSTATPATRARLPLSVRASMITSITQAVSAEVAATATMAAMPMA